MDGLSDNLYVSAAVPPVLVAVVGAVAKKLIRGRGRKWQASDFFLGQELTLCCLSTEIVYFVTLFRFLARHQTANPESQACMIGILLPTTLLVYLVILGWHQEWEPRRPATRRGKIIRFCWLGVAANLLGLGIFAGFIAVARASLGG